MAALPALAGRVSRDADVAPIENTDAKPRELGQVLLQVFLNKGGLGNALVKVSSAHGQMINNADNQSGSVPSWTVYDTFWQGFASAHDLFSGQ